jgi:hypothetical protein
MGDVIQEYELIEVLGRPSREDTGYAYWQCGDCLDDGCDNLVFNKSEMCFKSWCCDNSFGRKVYAQIIENRKKNSENLTPKSNTNIKIHRTHDQLMESFTNRQKRLFSNPRALDYIHKKRGLSAKTCLDCGIGLCENKNWSFPIWKKYREELAGFEIRRADLQSGVKNKIISKEMIVPGNFLSEIMGRSEKCRYCIITEGFIDGMSFYEYCLQLKIESEYHILSLVCGCSGLHSLINTVRAKTYEKVLVIMDMDEKGQEAINKASNEAIYNFEKVDIPCGCCNDINEYILKHPDMFLM